MIIFPSVAHWFLFPLTINAAGAVGDLWMVFSLLKYPEHVLLEDDPTGAIIYGENTYGIVKTSPKGFISDFFRGFLAVFSFLILLFYLIFPIILGIFNVDSLVLGVDNSPFTIFKFLGGGEEGYELFVGFLPLLSFSGVIGLIYGLARSGKRVKLNGYSKPKREIEGIKLLNKLKTLVIGVVIAAIIFGGVSLLLQAGQKESGVDIAYDVVSTQGAAENLSGMESVKVQGEVWNIGDKEAKNVTVTLIFTDAAHDRVIRKRVVEGVDLLPKGAVRVEFDTEYFREQTVPKTEVDLEIQVDWEGKKK